MFPSFQIKRFRLFDFASLLFLVVDLIGNFLDKVLRELNIVHMHVSVRYEFCDVPLLVLTFAIISRMMIQIRQHKSVLITTSVIIECVLSQRLGSMRTFSSPLFILRLFLIMYRSTLSQI